jgi:hypothetical protein
MSATRTVRKPRPRQRLARTRGAAWALLWCYLLAATLMPLAHAAVAKFERLPVTLCSAHGAGVIVIPLTDPAERKRVEQSMHAPACCSACAVPADIAAPPSLTAPNAPALLGSVDAQRPAEPPHLARANQQRARAPPLG